MGLDQIVHPSRRDAADPRLLDHGHQGLLAGLTGLEERREVAALPQLGNAQLQTAQPRVERPLAITVAVGRAVARSLVAAGADYALHIRLHEQLHNGLGYAAQKIAVSGFGQKLGKR